MLLSMLDPHVLKHCKAKVKQYSFFSSLSCLRCHVFECHWPDRFPHSLLFRLKPALGIKVNIYHFKSHIKLGRIMLPSMRIILACLAYWRVFAFVGLTCYALSFAGDAFVLMLLGNYSWPSIGLIWNSVTSAESALSFILKGTSSEPARKQIAGHSAPMKGEGWIAGMRLLGCVTWWALWIGGSYLVWSDFWGSRSHACALATPS